MKNDINISEVQYLFFILDDEKFAVKADNIKEIVDYVNITKIPIANNAIKGVTNIRGDIIPVIDPNIRFGFKKLDIKERTSFIIFNILNKEKNTYLTIALMVDLVIEVEEIKSTDILNVPEFGTKVPSNFIQNIIKFEDNYITTLDIDIVLDIKHLTKVN